MGQAKHRKKELEKFVLSLSKEEQIVFDLSKKTYERVICEHNLKGACYHMTYFLKMILRKKYGIETTAVIGFVNDGTDDILYSHGWLEYEDKKIDLAVAKPNFGDIFGPVLILDYKFQEHGSSEYSYYREMNAAGELAIQRLIEDDPRAKTLAEYKQQEHNFMVEISKSEEQIMSYLNNIPNGYTYSKLVNLLS
ncbi:hypothetical protein [Pseudobdellovibrio sp. HCB154]|uniref:hypothetical protein n=1 Tax=Pseudobdellovibrio sp. HCB154 TaxID=3386277 RepID=UPI0039171235